MNHAEGKECCRASTGAHTQEDVKRLVATTLGQQRALAQSLAELEEKNRILESQSEELQATNLRLATAQRIIKQKVDDLEKANRYKSEFLATMSHELRTPLNSILVLSKILSENRSGALNSKDIELADTIHSSGQSLLRLVNEVLDISKIEAGRMEIIIEDYQLDELLADLDRMFRELAQKKNLRFVIEHDPDLPASLRTDGHRLKQILINLLDNAGKFTEEGEFRLTASRAAAHFFDANHPFIPGAVAFTVADSGIGIAHDKQRAIFDAFQQAESGISRKYGGTGLGLAICRRLATLLGGFIHLESESDKGSVFTLIVPENLEAYIDAGLAQDDEENIAAATVPEDDREQLETGSRTILHIENDPISAQLICDSAHEYGFQYLLATNGEEGLKMARFHRPRAILLHTMLPDMDSKEVLRRLQAEADMAAIPVVLGVTAEQGNYRAQARRLGAVGALRKPATPVRIEAMFTTLRQLIEQRTPVLGLIGDGGDFPFPEHAAARIERITTVETLAEDFAAKTFDCLLMVNPGLALPAIIDQLAALDAPPPLLILAPNALDAESERLIVGASQVVTRTATSEKEVLRLLAIFLHRAAFYPTADAEDADGRALASPPFAGRTLLLGDGDLRHAFALSNGLEALGIHVVMGRDGEECLEKLKTEEIDAVLLDIDLPKRHGSATLAAIRADERFAHLPVILYGDAKSADSAAGANGFLEKPVSQKELLELLSAKL